MPNNNQYKQWSVLINSIKTPLGFFTFIALLLNFILTYLGTIDKISIVYPIAVLLILICFVFIISYFKPLALYHPNDWPKTKPNIILGLKFPKDIDPLTLDLCIDDCKMEVRGMDGKVKFIRTPNLKDDHGPWICDLPGEIEPTDSVRFSLIDQEKRQWYVNPFPPYKNERNVLLRKTI